MPSWITWIIQALIALWKSRGPSQVQQEAEKAGAAEAELASKGEADAQVTKAAAAGVAVDASIAGDSGLRKYEASDPNNRDNQT